MMVAMMMPILLRWMIFLDAVMERKHFPGSVLGFSTAFGGGYFFTFSVGVNNVYLIFTKKVHEVIDLLRGHHISGQDIIDFFIGQIAFLLAL